MKGGLQVPSARVEAAGELSATLWARVLPKLGISILIGAAFAWLAVRGGLPLVPAGAHFEGVRWWAVPAYGGLLLVTHLLRATRWRFLIAPVKRLPLGEVVVLNWVGFFAIFAFPLRLGELARPALTKLRHDIPISVGLGTVAVERVFDGMVTSLCVAWTLFALPRLTSYDAMGSYLLGYAWLALAAFVLAFAALGMFLWQRQLAVALVRRTVGRVSPRLADFVATRVAYVADGVRSIGDGRLLVAFAAETLAYWGVNALGMWVLAIGCGVPLSFGHALAVMGMLALGILLPAGPGQFGNFQLAIATVLKLYLAAHVVGTAGAAYIFLMYVVQAVMFIGTGVIPLYAMKLRVRDLLSRPASAEILPRPSGSS